MTEPQMAAEALCCNLSWTLSVHVNQKLNQKLQILDSSLHS